MAGLSSTRCSLLAVAMLSVVSVAAVAQGPVYDIGSAPAGRLPPADAAIGPDGTGLPPGRGTAVEGAMFYSARGCARCHGATGSEGPDSRLVGPPGAHVGIAAYPFAPLVWSYINKMMPKDLQIQHVAATVTPRLGWGSLSMGSGRACCLTPDEVYSLTAYLLYRNGIIQEDEVIDADRLPQIRMPNRDAYVPPPFSEWKPGLRHE